MCLSGWNLQTAYLCGNSERLNFFMGSTFICLLFMSVSLIVQNDRENHAHQTHRVGGTNVSSIGRGSLYRPIVRVSLSLFGKVYGLSPQGATDKIERSYHNILCTMHNAYVTPE